jgi:hypothetical protein
VTCIQGGTTSGTTETCYSNGVREIETPIMVSASAPYGGTEYHYLKADGTSCYYQDRIQTPGVTNEVNLTFKDAGGNQVATAVLSVTAAGQTLTYSCAGGSKTVDLTQCPPGTVNCTAGTCP